MAQLRWYIESVTYQVLITRVLQGFIYSYPARAIIYLVTSRVCLTVPSIFPLTITNGAIDAIKIMSSEYYLSLRGTYLSRQLQYIHNHPTLRHHNGISRKNKVKVQKVKQMMKKESWTRTTGQELS